MKALGQMLASFIISFTAVDVATVAADVNACASSQSAADAGVPVQP